METQAGERGTLRREAGEGRVVNTVMRKDQSSHRKKKRRTKEKKKERRRREKREEGGMHRGDGQVRQFPD